MAETHPPPAVPASNILKPCLLQYSVSNILTVEEVGYCHFKLGTISPSYWSKPDKSEVWSLFIDGHNNGGLLAATNAWVRELCESFTDWVESSWTLFFPSLLEFLLSKSSWYFFACSSIFPKQGLKGIPSHWRRWAIILVACTSGQMVPHRKHFILDLELLVIFWNGCCQRWSSKKLNLMLISPTHILV